MLRSDSECSGMQLRLRTQEETSIRETYGARLFCENGRRVSAEAGVHDGVERVSGQGGAGADAGQCCLWQGTQHWLKETQRSTLLLMVEQSYEFSRIDSENVPKFGG